MFAGHVGAALAIGRAERRVNVGVLISAALLLDALLWVFILLGWESVSIPANFSRTHQPQFIFPFSHSLVASLGWSALAGAAGLIWFAPLHETRWRAAALIAVAVFSHWLLDALVHRPEMPLTAEGSVKVGLGLWESMPTALAVEAAIAVAGLWLFVQGSGLARGRLVALVVLTVLALIGTVAGMTIAPPPPSAIAMAVSSLTTLTVVCALACWLGRLPGVRHA
jgi:hypothetical protein